MRFKGLIFLISFCLLLVSAVSNASNYKDWLPVLPQNIDSLAKSGQPDGVNMNSGGQSWSYLQQKYSDGAEREITLSIVTGAMAPQVRKFQSISDFNMETEDKTAKSLELSGRKAFLQLKKRDHSGTLIIAVQKQTIVVLEADPAEGEQDLVALSKEVPLAKIAEKIE